MEYAKNSRWWYFSIFLVAMTYIWLHISTYTEAFAPSYWRVIPFIYFSYKWVPTCWTCCTFVITQSYHHLWFSWFFPTETSNRWNWVNAGSWLGWGIVSSFSLANRFQFFSKSRKTSYCVWNSTKYQIPYESKLNYIQKIKGVAFE